MYLQDYRNKIKHLKPWKSWTTTCVRLLKLHLPVNSRTRDFSTRDFLACMIEKSSMTSYKQKEGSVFTNRCKLTFDVALSDNIKCVCVIPAPSQGGDNAVHYHFCSPHLSPLPTGVIIVHTT